MKKYLFVLAASLVAGSAWAAPFCEGTFNVNANGYRGYMTLYPSHGDSFTGSITFPGHAYNDSVQGHCHGRNIHFTRFMHAANQTQEFEGRFDFGGRIAGTFSYLGQVFRWTARR